MNVRARDVHPETFHPGTFHPGTFRPPTPGHIPASSWVDTDVIIHA